MLCKTIHSLSYIESICSSMLSMFWTVSNVLFISRMKKKMMKFWPFMEWRQPVNSSVVYFTKHRLQKRNTHQKPERLFRPLYSTNKRLLQHYHIAKGLTFNETNYQQETKRIQETLQKNAYSPTACDGLLTKFGHHQQNHNNCIE